MDRSTARARYEGKLLDSVQLPERPRPVSNQIADAFRSWIVREASPGDFLPPERVLQERYNVSRPTVREAIRMLEAEGLVEIKRGLHGGAIVREPEIYDLAFGIGIFLQRSAATISEVFQLRLLLEPEAARRAALRPDREEVARLLDASLAAEQDAVDSPELATVSRRIVEFHNVILALAGDRVLAIFGQLLEAVVYMHNERSLRAADNPAEWASDAHRAHHRIADAIRAGDAEGAARLSRRHLELSAQLILGDRGELQVDVLADREKLPR